MPEASSVRHVARTFLHICTGSLGRTVVDILSCNVQMSFFEVSFLSVPVLGLNAEES